MAEDVYLVAPSHRLVKVLAYNSAALLFDTAQKPRLKQPGTGVDSDGLLLGIKESDIKTAGEGGPLAPYSIFLQPYCEGPPGTAFYLNVWGYSPAGSNASANAPGPKTWIPFFVAQLYCVSGNIAGPAEDSYLAIKENLCDTLALMAGSLGGGYISAPGNDMAAFAKLDLLGAKFFEIEFAADPNTTGGIPVTGAPGMNAFWRPL